MYVSNGKHGIQWAAAICAVVIFGFASGSLGAGSISGVPGAAFSNRALMSRVATVTGVAPLLDVASTVSPGRSFRVTLAPDRLATLFVAILLASIAYAMCAYWTSRLHLIFYLKSNDDQSRSSEGFTWEEREELLDARWERERQRARAEKKRDRQLLRSLSLLLVGCAVFAPALAVLGSFFVNSPGHSPWWLAVKAYLLLAPASVIPCLCVRWASHHHSGTEIRDTTRAETLLRERNQRTLANGAWAGGVFAMTAVAAVTIAHLWVIWYVVSLVLWIAASLLVLFLVALMFDKLP